MELEQPVTLSYVQVAESILSKMKSKSVSSELGIPIPVGDGDTGDTSGLPLYVSGPFTCEVCPQDKTFNMKHPFARRFGHACTWTGEQMVATFPERCRECDTRYRKHKRTVNAIVRIYRHSKRQFFCEETKQWWNRTDVIGRRYRHIKFICLTVPNIIIPSMDPTPILTMGPIATGPENGPSPLEGLCPEGRGPLFSAALEQRAQQELSKLKEKFRRFRKRKWWKESVVYGRWFAEVTWTVHFQDGNKSDPTQWMPTSKELEGAVSVEIHPHLHVIAVAKYMDKEELTSWWESGTQIQATDSWWSTKKYLTKYLNKQQLEGRNQGTFGRIGKTK